MHREQLLPGLALIVAGADHLYIWWTRPELSCVSLLLASQPSSDTDIVLSDDEWQSDNNELAKHGEIRDPAIARTDIADHPGDCRQRHDKMTS